jgi:uncharacterized protein
MKVAIAGGTGFVGRRLVERLLETGHEVLVLTRNAANARSRLSPNVQVLECNVQKPGDWQNALSGYDGVVNLAGHPIAESRWTSAVKAEILNSRQLATQNLVHAIATASSKPSVLVNASAIGYYGSSESASFDEASSPGNDFLAQVCQTWEAEATKVKAADVRLVILRIGIVVGNGGAIAKMIPPFKLYGGGPIGNGKQWFSWIAREDLVNLILYALTQPSMSGTYNATAPHPVHMAELCQILGEVLQRPSWLPVPDIALKLLLGEGAQVVLEGQHVLPKNTQASGFQFQYPELKPALESFLKA